MIRVAGFRGRWLTPMLAVAALFGLWGCAGRVPTDDLTRGRAVSRKEPPVKPWTHLRFLDNPDEFHFAIVSDLWSGGRPGIFEDAVRKLNLLRPEFVICVGDLISGYGNKKTTERERDDFDQRVAPLEAPFFRVVGNHDVGFSAGRQVWQERYGRTYYHFVYRNVLFLCADTTENDREITAEQRAYFRKVLQDHPNARWTFVFLHHPHWMGHERPADKTGWNDFIALLGSRPYTVFAGHEHAYMKSVRNGRNFIMLATTGGGSSGGDPAFGEFDEIVWVTMSAKGPAIANLDLKGIYDEDVCTEEALKTLMSLRVTADPVIATERLFSSATTAVRFYNGSALPATVTVTATPNRLLRATPSMSAFLLAPETTETLTLDVQTQHPKNVADLDPVSLDYRVEFGRSALPPFGHTFSHRLAVVDASLPCPKAKRAVKIDGRLDPGEWKGAYFSAGGGRKDAQPRDGEFRIAVRHDARYVYLAVEVADDRVVVVPGRSASLNDGISVAFDARPGGFSLWDGGRGQSQGLLTYWFNPGETIRTMTGMEERGGAFLQDMEVACLKTPGGYCLEMAIPAAYLDHFQGGAWKAFQLNLRVHDVDAPQDKGRDLKWGTAMFGESEYAPAATAFRRQ